MNLHLMSLAADQGGVVMRRQAVAAGYAAEEIDYLVRRGEWVSIRRGAYVERDIHDNMTDEDRHRALIHAAVRSLHKPAVVSHASAVVLRDLPTWGLDLSEVHVTRGDLHSPRHEAGVYHHVGDLKTEEIVSVQGVATTALARTVIDTARFSSFEAGVVVADAAFRSDPAAREQALARLTR
jgi:predicted transcriptional regulator of viral defense system